MFFFASQCLAQNQNILGIRMQGHSREMKNIYRKKVGISICGIKKGKNKQKKYKKMDHVIREKTNFCCIDCLTFKKAAR